tara:strand:- start:1023 stop:1589 length:567 start_codon:yes stop_codon:yes gene_type:complete
MKNNIQELKIILADFCDEMQVNLSERLKVLWLSELQKEDIQAVRRAISNIMTGKYEVYGKAGLRHILSQIRGNTEQDAQLKKEKLEKQADDAYIELRRCICSMSPYSNFKHEDKALIACVAELGGWMSITGKTSTDLDYMKRNFLERYKQNAQVDSASLPDKAIGFAEQQNSRKISRGTVNIGNLKVV